MRAEGNAGRRGQEAGEEEPGRGAGAEEVLPSEAALLVAAGPDRRAENEGRSSWPGLGLERPRSAHDQMLRVLALEIMDGAYDVTGFPSEAALLGRFQVSRSFLREVIRGLTAKGFLSVKTRVGATVRRAEHWSHFDRDVLRWRLSAGDNPVFGEDLRAMCLGLECEAARRAAKRRSLDDLQVLDQCLADLAADPSDTAIRIIQRVFRLTICAASDRPVMRSLSGLIEAQLLLDARWKRGSTADRSRAMRRVFYAVRDGDEVAAAAAMRQVIG
ncbi:FadR/GntR family transcriptional regulator [Caulobacter sp. LjRoot300]|uniref:FadR/GntR family transcriptional regulator n=1 Tax=Caulobacter sp. LjRoot300 TaxID=3342321 RepID=UPI003ECDAC77